MIDGKPATLRDMVCMALTNRFPCDPPDHGEFGYMMYRLARKLHTADFVDLTDEEVKLIKSRVGSAILGAGYTVIGRVFEQLEAPPQCVVQPLEVIVHPHFDGSGFDHILSNGGQVNG